MPGPWTLGLCVTFAALASIVAPLTIYAFSLAAFGLAHVLAELRYLDARFAARLSRTFWLWLGLGLAGVASLRILGAAGVLDEARRAPLELALVALLAASAVPALLRRGPAAALLGATVISAIAAGIAFAPVHTLLLLAVLHNLTPIGFLAERLRGEPRKRAMLVCAVVFGLIPLAIASGMPGRWMPTWLSVDGALTAWASHLNFLGAYLPAPWQGERWALQLFSAAVFLQVAHYATVLHVLPRLSDPDHGLRTLLPWPRRSRFLYGTVALACLLFVGFVASFGGARSIYGIAAAVHAWIELPLLLFALGLPLGRSPMSVNEEPLPAGGAR